MSIYQDTRVPYTYLIKWSSTGMQYYGVRVAKDCHPSDLWHKYYTSSKYVKDYRCVHGEPDVIEIRKIFHGHNAIGRALTWEKRVLHKINAKNRVDYLNKSNGWNTQPPLPGWNKGLTKETNTVLANMSLKVSQTLTGRNSQNDPGRLAAALKLTGRTKDTHESIARGSAKLVGRTKYNDPVKAETGKKISQTMTGRTKETHPHLAELSKKYQNTYEIKLPDGSLIVIKDIKAWCQQYQFNINSVRSACRTGSLHRGHLFKNLGKL